VPNTIKTVANLKSHNQDIHPTDFFALALLLARRLVNVLSQFCYANHQFIP
jgi:hypothetical protein